MGSTDKLRVGIGDSPCWIGPLTFSVVVDLVEVTWGSYTVPHNALSLFRIAIKSCFPHWCAGGPFYILLICICYFNVFLMVRFCEHETSAL